VRPEHFTLADQGQGLVSQVVVVEPTGADIQVNSKIGDSDVVSVFRERHDFSPGDIIRLQPDLTKVHLFQTQSGRALAQVFSIK
jgi:multiple sugar transport system ATP-binding protein